MLISRNDLQSYLGSLAMAPLDWSHHY